MDYYNCQEYPIPTDISVISDNEDDSPPPKHSKRILWYRLTGLTIGRQQAEEAAKQDIHHPTAM